MSRQDDKTVHHVSETHVFFSEEAWFVNPPSVHLTRRGFFFFDRSHTCYSRGSHSKLRYLSWLLVPTSLKFFEIN